jgi:inner membrane protein
MDSLSQIVLGAAVGEAVLGRKAGNKAIMWGAIGGTIPDLDVFFTRLFPVVDGMAFHRGFSHSLVFCVIAAPLLGWLIQRIHFKMPITTKEWSWLMFWALFTHPILDCFTAWGTQLFWPFEWRIAIESVFVIDPLYTVPFLLFVLAVMFFNRRSKTRFRLNTIGLILSTAYLLWGVFVQQIINSKLEKDLAAKNINYKEVKAKAMPITTFYWQGVAETYDGFYLSSYSIFDRKDADIDWVFYPKNHDLIEKHSLMDDSQFRRLYFLTNHHLTLEEIGDTLKINDVRFGRTDVISKDLSGEWLFHFYFKKNGSGFEIIKGQARSDIAKVNMRNYVNRIFGKKY